MKKKLLRCILCILCFVSLSNTLKAQQEISTAFSEQMTIVFGSLEPLRVPHGLLFNMALEQAQLPNYKGNLLTDSNKISIAEFHAIYQTLRTMRFNANAATFSPSTTIDSLAMLQRQPGRILLSGLFYRFSEIRDDALTANLINQSGNTLTDKYVGGIWQNPYQTENVFAMAPANARLHGLAQEILLPTNLWFGNDMSAIVSAEIDAGDGQGYRTLNAGTSLNVNYPDTGYKTLTYKLNLLVGGSLYAHSQIHVAVNTFYNEELSRSTKPPAMTPIFVTATDAFGGQYAEGYITIKYADFDAGLVNPLIVAEGFDSGHITNPENLLGDTNIDGFITDASNDGNSNLKTALISSPQYDIVYVDWKRGTDNIKKNAQLLKEVIRLVNNLKSDAGSTAKNIIIGQSMGGLVARWALKEMENDSEDHQTNLFVSYDTPHQGANVPLGYQYLARHAFNLYVRTGVTALTYEVVQLIGGGASPARIMNLSNTAAARQMLINYVGNNNQINNTVHATWQADLQTLGYPQGFTGKPLRIVAVSNASECATPQDGGPNALALNYVGKGNTRFLGDLASTVVAPYAFPLIAVFTNQPAFFLGVLPGRTDLNFDIKINFTGNGGGNRVYYNKITLTKKILWLLPLTVDVTNKSYYAPANQLTYDTYPGGTKDTQQDFSNVQYRDAFLKFNITASHLPTFNFVPVTSALDIGSGAVTLTDTDYTTKYIGASPPTGSKASPFANFITAFNNNATANEDHVSIQARNGDWLAAEILAASTSSSLPTAPNCTFICTNPPIISGPTHSGTATTYTLSNVPPGATVRWEVPSPYATTTPSITGTTATVGVIIPPFNTQFAELVAFVTTDCGETPFTKTLAPPIITTSLSTGGSACGEGTATINVPAGANFVWTPEGDISIEGLPAGQPFYTTSNSVSITGISGAITVDFQSYGNTVTAMEVYRPYEKELVISGYLPLLPADPLTITAQNIDFPADTFNWYINNVLVQSSTSEIFMGGQHWEKYNRICDYNDVRLEAVLPCGANVVIGEITFEQLCNGGWWRAMMVYPNPASSYISITLDAEEMKSLPARAKAKMKEYEVSLFDIKGKLLLKGRSSNFKIQLDTKQLKSATYFLHVKMDGEKEVNKQQIIIRN